MELEEYLPRLRGAFRLFIEAARQEDDSELRVKAESALSEIKKVVTEIMESSKGQVVGVEAQVVLNEIAYVLGFQDEQALKAALGIKEEKKQEHVPPPPP